MDWLTDATGGVDISEILDAITAGSLITICLIPTFILLIVIAIIVKIVKRRKAKKNKHKSQIKSNSKGNTNKDKIQEVQLDKDAKHFKTKRRYGLGMTSSQLHAELGYDTVDISVLDNIKEPEHSMDLNMTFNNTNKTKKKN